jgi:hypothetical protein
VKYGVALINSSISSSTNTWEHICWTIDGTNLATLYKNGTSVFSGNTSAITSSTSGFSLAAARDGTNTIDTTTLWPGRIDYATVRSALLTSDWIAAEYANQNNPAGYWTVASAGSSTRRRVIITQ